MKKNIKKSNESKSELVFSPLLPRILIVLIDLSHSQWFQKVQCQAEATANPDTMNFW